MTGVSPVTAMHKKMHHWAGQEQKDKTSAQDMRLVFLPQHNYGDRQKPKKHKKGSRPQETGLVPCIAVGLSVVFFMHNVLLFDDELAWELAHGEGRHVP